MNVYSNKVDKLRRDFYGAVVGAGGVLEDSSDGARAMSEQEV